VRKFPKSRQKRKSRPDKSGRPPKPSSIYFIQ